MVAGTRLAAVCWGGAGWFHAQYVGHGACPLDGNLSRKNPVADGLFLGNRTGRSHLYCWSTRVGGVGRHGSAAGRLAGGSCFTDCGCSGFVAAKRERTRNSSSGAGQGARRSVLRIHSVRLLALLMVAMGVIVGTVDIVSVAFAQERGQPGAASVVLSAYALGSCLAGLAFGALKLSTPLHRLLLLGGLATAATTLPLLFVGSVLELAAAVLLAGVFFAPTMIVAMSLVERLVSEQQLTEGMTWLLAGLNVGVAMGAAASGQLVDMGEARSGITVALYAAAGVLLLAGCGYQRLRQSAATPSCAF